MVTPWIIAGSVVTVPKEAATGIAHALTSRMQKSTTIGFMVPPECKHHNILVQTI
jgi:hypothetical protein